MSKAPRTRSGESHNGHPTVGRQTAHVASTNEEMEPKGYPTADRYHAETAHSAETHDPLKTKKRNHDG